jgi:uncharacterized radical SAM superfamily Fe-S cluster-containing enzyme
MSIEVDRNFKQIQNLRFFEIKKSKLEQNSRNGERKPIGIKVRGNYKTKLKQFLAIEKMKKALIEGKIIKVAVSETDYGLHSAMTLFKRHTGLTMRQFQDQYSPQGLSTSCK